MKNIILFFTILIISLSACQKEEVQSEVLLPRFFEFTFDGVEYRRDFSHQDDHASMFTGGFFKFKIDEDQRVLFYSINLDEQLEEGILNDLYFQYDGMGSSYYNSYGGTINILKIDRIDNFMVGTFSGAASGIEITNGRFIIDYFN